MSWLEITLNTASSTISDVAAGLTAGGFEDLVIEDQEEFEEFLEQNRGYWDYIDENLQQQLEGLSRIKLYLEDEDEAGLARLKALVSSLEERFGSLNMIVATGRAKNVLFCKSRKIITKNGGHNYEDRRRYVNQCRTD